MIFTTENPSDILVTNKTAFINLKDGKLSIKEVDGEIKEYFLILLKLSKYYHDFQLWTFHCH